MSLPTNILDFASAGDRKISEDEAALVMARAVKLVEDFAAQNVPDTLDAALAAASDDDPAEAARRVKAIAEETIIQGQILEDELTRFLELTPED